MEEQYIDNELLDLVLSSIDTGFNIADLEVKYHEEFGPDEDEYGPELEGYSGFTVEYQGILINKEFWFYSNSPKLPSGEVETPEVVLERLLKRSWNYWQNMSDREKFFGKLLGK